MILYSIILFVVAAIILLMSRAIYRGNTELIHDYHQTKVTDKAAYGKAFGKALSIVGLALLLSGVLALCGDAAPIQIASLAVLFVGIGIGIACIIAVQRKYNQGVF